MELIALVAEIVLASVFALAGITKLFSLQRFRATVVNFGIPDRAASPIGLVLPFTELAAAVLLLSGHTAWWGAACGLALLALFILAISISLARGKRPDCQCFGQLHSEPVGPWTLVRNGLLASLAGLVMWWASHHPGLGVLTALALAFARYGAALLVGAVVISAVALQSWLILHLFRQNGRLLLRIEGLEAGQHNAPHNHQVAHTQAGLRVGSPAPKFELPLASAGTASLDHLLATGKPALLVFSDANCGPCQALLPDIARWQREFSSKMSVALVSRGARHDKIAAKHKLQNVFVQKDREVAGQYLAFGTPTAVLVRADGAVASGLASGAAQIGELVNAVASGKLPMAPAPKISALKIGDPAPAFSARNLNGATVQTGDLKGGKTMLLFWNPSCGFCQRMLADVKGWEPTEARNGEPRILVLSSGTAEENRGMALSSPVLMDESGVSRLFGATGTPSAVLIDEQGRIASGLAVGSMAIAELRTSTIKVAQKTETAMLTTPPTLAEVNAD